MEFPEEVSAEDLPSCAVCLGELSVPISPRGTGSAIVRTACGHDFHLSCMLSCLEHQGGSCPVCRQLVDDELAAAPRGWMGGRVRVRPSAGRLPSTPRDGLSTTTGANLTSFSGDLAAMALHIAQNVRRSVRHEEAIDVIDLATSAQEQLPSPPGSGGVSRRSSDTVEDVDERELGAAGSIPSTAGTSLSPSHRSVVAGGGVSVPTTPGQPRINMRRRLLGESILCAEIAEVIQRRSPGQLTPSSQDVDAVNAAFLDLAGSLQTAENNFMAPGPPDHHRDNGVDADVDDAHSPIQDSAQGAAESPRHACHQARSSCFCPRSEW